MHEPAATLEAGGDHLKETIAKQFPHPPGTGPMKFIYATGARPLDGYTIKRGVGVGGFGEVYFATSDAGKEVALKRIQRNLDVEIRGVTHCLNLKHPNLIAVYDIKYDDHGEGWIVMEYVTGESLKDVIDRNPHGMPVDEVRFWFAGIAAGVAYLHDHGIVHRDLKPGNIFLDESVVKIGDYGLSKFISCSRRSGQTESVGTFHYMAPEIGKGVYGKEIDIYALGIILFEMLTGHVPFEGESSQEIIMKHLTADPNLDGVSQPYRRVIERALFKDPAKRYSSVSDMLHALQLDGTGAPVRVAQADVPPVLPPVPAPSQKTDPTAPLYINGEGIATDEIVFGPVVEVVADSGQTPAMPAGQRGTREPIAAAIGQGCSRMMHWWNTANVSTPIKIALLVGAVLFLVLNSEWLMPAGIALGFIYLVYLGIRTIIVGSRSTSNTESRPPAQTQVVAVQGKGRRARRRRRRRVPWQQRARETLGHKPASQRFSELTGSLLMSAIVCGVLSILILVAVGRNLDGSVDTWTLFAWMTVSSIAGSWLVLSLGKSWERSDGDEVLRRFAMMVAGLVLGLICFGLADTLMIRLSTHDPMFNPLEMPTEWIPAFMYAADGTPLLTAFLSYFASVFLILRWWRQGDPLRKTRFSLWTMIVCGFWGMVFPWQIPWGFWIVGIVAVATQLSASWMGESDRSRVRHEVLEA